MRNLMTALVLAVFGGYCSAAPADPALPRIVGKACPVAGGSCDCGCITGKPCTCLDPAYKAAVAKVLSTKVGGDSLYYGALIVYVGQPVPADFIQGYWTYLPVSVPALPDAAVPSVVIGIPDGHGGLNRARDLPGKPTGPDIYHAWLAAAFHRQPQPVTYQPVFQPIRQMFGGCAGGACRSCR